jgi:hypothetical protein
VRETFYMISLTFGGLEHLVRAHRLITTSSSVRAGTEPDWATTNGSELPKASFTLLLLSSTQTVQCITQSEDGKHKAQAWNL